MPSYPLAIQLPPSIDTKNWRWKRFKRPSSRGQFWIGIDEEGKRWLTKMRGSFLGYREIVFNRLVQQAGWLCQSSTFAILDNDSKPIQENPQANSIQAVTVFLSEHGQEDCGSECPISPLRDIETGNVDNYLKQLHISTLVDSLNHARMYILAPLLGGNEPADCLTTKDHQVFLIDGELMFCTDPSDVRETPWWNNSDNSPSTYGQRLTHEICAKIGAFDDVEIEKFLETPRELNIDPEPIRRILYKARNYGRDFARIQLNDF